MYPLAHFRVLNGEDFEKFIKQFELGYMANNWPADKQTQVLGCQLRGRAEHVYHTLTDTDKADYNTLKSKLREKLQTSDHSRLTHQLFANRKQKPGESPGAYGYVLYDLALAAYPSMDSAQRDNLVREQFITGISQQLQGLVTYSNPKTFGRSRDHGRQAE